LFAGLEDYRIFRSTAKWFPLPGLRRLVEKRWGVFLTLSARKPSVPR
jgi:hypothetical protein